MTRRLPPLSGNEELDFLFSIQDEMGMSSSELGRRINSNGEIVSMMRRGTRKRTINPTAQRIARVFGYEWKLVRVQ